MAEKQKGLFDDFDNKWEAEWKDMPEFNMNHINPIRTIKINFLTDEDVKKFEAILGQKINSYENYWFPKLNFKADSTQIFVDEP